MLETKDIPDLSQEALAQMILTKHEKLLQQYERDLTYGQRVIILAEKLDQLEHWIRDARLGEAESYANKKRETETELRLIQDTLHTNRMPKNLDEKIAQQKAAIAYWKKR